MSAAKSRAWIIAGQEFYDESQSFSTHEDFEPSLGYRLVD